jgi:hypothetical protein
MRLVRRVGRQVVPLVVLALLVTAGLILYHGEREGRDRSYSVGADAPNRVDIAITIERMDPVSQRLTLQLLPIARGDLTVEQNSLIPTRQLTVGTTSLTKSVIEYPAGQRATSAELTVNAIGITSDYPFDHYTATIGVSAHDDSGPLPVSLTLDDTDPSFALSVAQDESTQGAVFLDVTLSRSRSTLIFAWLMMVIMWALALTVAAAARVQVTQRRGLTWPALGWMAATLFALTAFRNAAPGSPPVGSVLDYAAYLWAELIVAISVIVTAVAGIRAERSSSGAGNDVQLLATAGAHAGLLTGVSTACSVNSWTGLAGASYWLVSVVSRRQGCQLLAGQPPAGRLAPSSGNAVPPERETWSLPFLPDTAWCTKTATSKTATTSRMRSTRPAAPWPGRSEAPSSR